MPARALFSSLLLVLMLAVTVAAAPAAVVAPKPKTKIAVGAKKKPKKAKKAKRVATGSSLARTPVVSAPATPVTCANADLLPEAGNLELIRAAIACLHNQVRAQHGLGTLAANRALASAGAAHAADMVARGYFDHISPEGGMFDQRIIAAGYAGADDAWTLGENLAWGTDRLATPSALIQSWMNSSGHRENVLKPAYRELGLGVTLGTPSGAAGGITVAAEFGARG